MCRSGAHRGFFVWAAPGARHIVTSLARTSEASLGGLDSAEACRIHRLSSPLGSRPSSMASSTFIESVWHLVHGVSSAETGLKHGGRVPPSSRTRFGVAARRLCVRIAPTGGSVRRTVHGRGCRNNSGMARAVLMINDPSARRARLGPSEALDSYLEVRSSLCARATRRASSGRRHRKGRFSG